MPNCSRLVRALVLMLLSLKVFVQFRKHNFVQSLLTFLHELLLDFFEFLQVLIYGVLLHLHDLTPSLLIKLQE